MTVPYTDGKVWSRSGQIGRSLSDWLDDTANLVAFRLATDTDWTLAFSRALATGKPVVVPYSATAYTVSGSITVPAGGSIVGMGGRPTIQWVSATTTSYTVDLTAGNCTLRDLVLDKNKASTTWTGADAVKMTGASGNYLDHVKVMNSNAIAFSVGSGTDSVILNCHADNCNGHGVYISGGSRNLINGLKVSNGGSFGVILANGAFKNEVIAARCSSNAIELVGVTQNSYQNRIIGNHSEGTGDNGISITGYLNEVIGNVCIGCAGNGIHLYGERNTVVGNVCLNNAQQNATNSLWRAGIAVQQGFGGTGQYNVVTGNVCDDDQGTPTQAYGVWLTGQTYSAWASGVSISSGAYRYNGLNLYQAASSGTTGATAPTWTSGTQSDGGVSWTFLRTFLAGTTAADNNEIAGNNVIRAGTALYKDDAVGQYNEILGYQGNLTVGRLGGAGNKASGQASMCFGQFNIAGAVGAFSGGSACQALGTTSFVWGSSALADGDYSVVFGRYGSSRGTYGKFVVGSGSFGATFGTGDAQAGNHVLRAATTDGTATRLTSDQAAASAGNSIPLANNSLYAVRGRVVARNTGTGDASDWEVKATIKRGASAAATALVGSATVTNLNHDTNAAAWTLSVAADTTNGCLSVTGTGAAATNIHWVANLVTTEVI